MFLSLEEYRIAKNREFFKCSIETIKENFDKIEKIFKDNNYQEIKKLVPDLNDKIRELTKKKFVIYFENAKINNLLSNKNITCDNYKCYICKNCNYFTNNKSHYNRHINSKKHIINSGELTIPKLDSNNYFTCEYCNNIYKKANKSRHLRMCKAKKKEIIELKQTINLIVNNKVILSNYNITTNKKLIDTVDSKKFICDYCEKEYKKANKYRHLKTCKAKQDENVILKKNLKLIINNYNKS